MRVSTTEFHLAAAGQHRPDQRALEYLTQQWKQANREMTKCCCRRRASVTVSLQCGHGRTTLGRVWRQGAQQWIGRRQPDGRNRHRQADALLAGHGYEHHAVASITEQRLRDPKGVFPCEQRHSKLARKMYDWLPRNLCVMRTGRLGTTKKRIYRWAPRVTRSASLKRYPLNEVEKSAVDLRLTLTNACLSH